MKNHPTPVIVIFFGLIASGKSTLAKMWAKEHKMVYYNSDVIRKELAAVHQAKQSPNSSFLQGIYTPEFTDQTYKTMFARAADDLSRGSAVVLDASFASVNYRQRAIELAAELQVPCWFVLCYCSEAETRRRLRLRAQDPEAVSEGRWDIYLEQKKHFADPDKLTANLVSLNTEDQPKNLVKRVNKRLPTDFPAAGDS